MTSLTPPASARHYRGIPPEQRRATRRQQLIGAAIRVYGQQGYRQATVKAICEAAGLTERYFYESFANSEQLLIACYEAVMQQLSEQLLEAARTAAPQRVARIRAMLRRYFTALQQDPAGARVFLVEIRGVSAAVDAAFDASLLAVGQRVAQVALPRGPLPDPLLQTGVFGGIMQMALRWIAQQYSPAVDHLTETGLCLCAVLWQKPRVRSAAN
jgi:AcrR family transcriptional regulator